MRIMAHLFCLKRQATLKVAIVVKILVFVVAMIVAGTRATAKLPATSFERTFYFHHEK